MKRAFLILFFFVFLFKISSGQEIGKVYVIAYIVDGDTLPVISLNEVIIEASRTWKSKRAQKRYSKLVRNARVSTQPVQA